MNRTVLKSVSSQASLIIVVVILVLAAGGYYISQNRNTTSNQPSPAPTTNAQMLETDNNTPIITEDINYFPEAKGYFARPEAKGSYPGVVMIHENRGLRPEIKATADQLAKEGYMVLAVDLYKGQVVESQDEARKISGSFNQEEGIENMKVAKALLKEKGATKIASLGWCFGGRQSIAFAIAEPLDATVVYYGGNMASKEEELKPIDWPVLGVFGDKDQAIPIEKVKEFETSLNNLGVENEIYIYPGVGHAFANPSGTNYAPNETKDAWGKTLAFLNKHLKG